MCCGLLLLLHCRSRCKLLLLLLHCRWLCGDCSGCCLVRSCSYLRSLECLLRCRLLRWLLLLLLLLLLVLWAAVPACCWTALPELLLLRVPHFCRLLLLLLGLLPPLVQWRAPLVGWCCCLLLLCSLLPLPLGLALHPQRLLPRSLPLRLPLPLLVLLPATPPKATTRGLLPLLVLVSWVQGGGRGGLCRLLHRLVTLSSICSRRGGSRRLALAGPQQLLAPAQRHILHCFPFWRCRWCRRWLWLHMRPLLYGLLLPLGGWPRRPLLHRLLLSGALHLPPPLGQWHILLCHFSGHLLLLVVVVVVLLLLLLAPGAPTWLCQPRLLWAGI